MNVVGKLLSTAFQRHQFRWILSSIDRPTALARGVTHVSCNADVSGGSYIGEHLPEVRADGPVVKSRGGSPSYLPPEVPARTTAGFIGVGVTLRISQTRSNSALFVKTSKT